MGVVSSKGVLEHSEWAPDFKVSQQLIHSTPSVIYSQSVVPLINANLVIQPIL